MFTIEDRGVLFDTSGRPASEQIAYFTALCPLSSGTILCGFQLGSMKHSPTSTIRLCRSRDEGRTWTELPARWQSQIEGIPGSLGAVELVEVRPGKILMYASWFDRSEPHRPVFDPVTEGILHCKQLLSFSSDEGDIWSDWRQLEAPGLTACTSTGPLLQWKDGTIAIPFESFKEFDDPRPGHHAAWLRTSCDGGETFSDPLQVAQHPDFTVNYWDQRLCVQPDAHEFIAMFWTHDLAQKRDLTVHLRRARVDGKTIVGPPVQATTIPGQIAAPLLLDDGRLLAFVVYRGTPSTMTLWCSPDGGKTWPESDRLIVHVHDERAAISQGRENIDFKQYWEDMGKWSFGHPAIRPLGSGRLLLAHYAGIPRLYEYPLGTRP